MISHSTTTTVATLALLNLAVLAAPLWAQGKDQQTPCGP